MSVIIIINCVRGNGIVGCGLDHLFLHIRLSFFFSFFPQDDDKTECESDFVC